MFPFSEICENILQVQRSVTHWFFYLINLFFACLILLSWVALVKETINPIQKNGSKINFNCKIDFWAWEWPLPINMKFAESLFLFWPERTSFLNKHKTLYWWRRKHIRYSWFSPTLYTLNHKCFLFIYVQCSHCPPPFFSQDLFSLLD